YRVQNGGFQSPADPRQIKDIGEKTLAKIRPFLTVGRPTAPAADAASPEPLTLKHAKTNRAPGKSRGP
ncbi:MAG: hypothetical protein QGD94_06455, partial [Planctomycetia bacterium]|nr:hypothetical protein [Planctomycetia bacterium]